MAATAVYKVTHPDAPRHAADPLIGVVARAILDETVARTPHGETGELAAGWHVEHGRAPAAYLVLNDVPYSAFVEYGTAHDAAQPMIGPVIAEWRSRVSHR